MSQTQTSDVIEGLPPGAILKPLPKQLVEGLPPGAILKAIDKSQSTQTAPPPVAPIPILEGYQKTGAAIVDAGKNFLSAFGYNPEARQAAEQKTQGMSPLQEGLAATAPHPIEMIKNAATAVAHEFQKGSEEGKASLTAAQQGDVKGVLAHTVGQVGHAGATLMAPIAGEGPSKAGEQYGSGDISGGLGTTAALLAPIALSHMLPKGARPAGEVQPAHVEALTGLIEDKGGTVDPHETATAALPHLRETAVRMKVDPSKLQGREAGQATLKVAEQAVRDTQNEFNTIKKPYENVLVDQKPIADAYRAAITPELLANEPSVAVALKKQAKKFDQPTPLEQLNQFRTRMNNQLDAFEKRGQTAQIMSDIETKAMKAAANAARDVEYSTVGRLSGLDPEYVRALKQKEGSLIEAKSSLTKEYNRASGDQGEATSKGIREKVANTYPSPRGVKHAGIRELIGPKPIDVLNNRIQKMFADMGTASPLPEYQQVMPPEAPQPQGGPSGPLPGGEDAIEEATRGGPGMQPPVAPDTSQTFVRPSRMGTQQGIADQVVAAKSGKSTTDLSRVDQHKMAKEAMGQELQSPVANGQITQAHVDAENAFYTQARAELGANAEPSAVLARAQALKVEHVAKGAPAPTTPVPSTVRPTLTHPAPSWVTEQRGNWFSTDQARAQGYAREGGNLKFVDVPKSVADATDTSMPGRAENVLPSVWSAKAQPLSADTPAPATGMVRLFRGEAKPTLTQRMQAQPLPKLKRVEMPSGGPQSASGASRQSQAALIMLQAKNGQITPAEADSRIQKLVGSQARRTVRMLVRPD